LKHATARALDELEDLLKELRQFSALKEKQRGIFYLKSTAFLHFHEDSTGLFADLKIKDEFERFALNNGIEKKILLSKIKPAIAALNL
jgi:hypothetical protein